MRCGRWMLCVAAFGAACSSDAIPHGGAARSSVSEGPGLGQLGALAWKADLEAAQPLARVGDEIWVVREDSLARATDDGSVDEPAPIAARPSSAMTVVGGAAYYGSGKSVVAVGFPSGEPIWSTKVGDSVVASPLVVGGAVVAAAGDLVALDAGTGEERWRYRAEGDLRGAPALWGDDIFVVSSRGVIYAIDLGSGQPRWQFQTGAEFGAVPVAAGDEVVVAGGRDGVVWAVFRETGRERWRLPTQGVISSGAALRDRFAWIGTEGGVVHAINVRTGQELWRTAELAAVVAPPVWGGGRLYVACDDGNLVALDAEDGARLWAFQLESEPLGPPVPGDAEMWMADRVGRVYHIR